MRNFSGVFSLTLSKIAKIANVSVSTVSKVFSNSHEISTETKQRVIEIAKALGCFEKYSKPIYDKKLIAVICPEVLGIHYSDMVTIIEEIISKRGGTCLVSVSRFSAHTQNELLDYYINFAKVDGIIIIEPIGQPTVNTSIPIVQIGHGSGFRNVSCVNAEIRPALDRAISLLQKNGHSKIGFIGERFSPEEYGVFQHAIKKRSLEVNHDYVVINDRRFWDCGYCGMDEILKRSDRPTAIFAAYGHIAVGMLQRLNEEGLRVPNDFSLVCMDDISSVPYANLKLSCIKMHLSELCCEAVRLLYRALDEPDGYAPQVISVTRQFDEGESIGNMRNR